MSILKVEHPSYQNYRIRYAINGSISELTIVADSEKLAICLLKELVS